MFRKESYLCIIHYMGIKIFSFEIRFPKLVVPDLLTWIFWNLHKLGSSTFTHYMQDNTVINIHTWLYIYINRQVLSCNTFGWAPTLVYLHGHVTIGKWKSCKKKYYLLRTWHDRNAWDIMWKYWTYQNWHFLFTLRI